MPSQKFRQPHLYPSPHPVLVDPSAKGTVIRHALAFEVLFNLLGAFTFVFAPQNILALMVPNGVAVSLTSIQLLQWLGALDFALTPSLLMGVPNTRGCIETRRATYWTYLAVEVALLPVVSWQLFKAETPEGELGFTTTTLWIVIGNLVPLAIWRLYALLLKPQWFGRYRDGDDKVK